MVCLAVSFITFSQIHSLCEHLGHARSSFVWMRQAMKSSNKKYNASSGAPGTQRVLRTVAVITTARLSPPALPDSECHAIPDGVQPTFKKWCQLFMYMGCSVIVSCVCGMQ